MTKECWELKTYPGLNRYRDFMLITENTDYYCNLSKGSLTSGVLYVANLIKHPNSFLFNFEGILYEANFIKVSSANPLSAYYEFKPM
jgi:hypothetical protein